LDAEPDPQKAAERLVAEANREGGEDNITVILVDVVDDEGGLHDPTEGGTITVLSTDVRPGGVTNGNGSRGGNGGGAVGTTEEARHAETNGHVRWRGVAMWVAVAVIAVVVALFGARIYVNHQWYVGEANGRVAIYHGIPAEPLGIHLSHVYTVTGFSSAQAQQLQPY